GRSSVAASTGEDTFGGSTSAADSGVVSRASPSAASEPGFAGADASLDAAGLASEGGGGGGGSGAVGIATSPESRSTTRDSFAFAFPPADVSGSAALGGGGGGAAGSATS